MHGLDLGENQTSVTNPEQLSITRHDFEKVIDVFEKIVVLDQN